MLDILVFVGLSMGVMVGIILVVVICLVVIIGGWFFWCWWWVGRYDVFIEIDDLGELGVDGVVDCKELVLELYVWEMFFDV